ncbi:hypothetical protein [Streptomyces sp. NBC_01725]|uniref:hypothetical protein n=1 Tax=Streptomyces sp. NBC_01725 TaxID=2975923 RepID=UPI002E27F8C7|nr:hypothetical protein [Streptomyces sp. NBC_01725]
MADRLRIRLHAGEQHLLQRLARVHGRAAPTSIRSTAAGLAYSLSKLSAAAIPFVLLPVLTSYGAAPALAVVSVAMALLATLVFTSPPAPRAPRWT